VHPALPPAAEPKHNGAMQVPSGPDPATTALDTDPMPTPMDRAVIVLDQDRVHWTSDPRGPGALAGLFHTEQPGAEQPGAEQPGAEDAAGSWVTAAGDPCRRRDLPVFRALADRVPVTGELLGHLAPDGSTRWLLLTAHPVDWQGAPAVSVVVEEAGPVLARERLQRRMAAAQAQARMATWVLDLESGLVETTNGEALWGLPVTGVPRPIEDYLQFVHEDDVGRVRAAIQRAGEQSSQELTVAVELADGARRWYHLLMGRGDDESPTTLRGLTRDVTRHHEAESATTRMEAQLAQAARLESLGQLAGGIAHDVNNLLGAVGIQVELAERALRRGEAASSYLHDIGEAVDRGVDLTRQLLAFSRLDEVHAELVDVNQVASQVRSLTRGLLPAQITQRLETTPDLPPVVLARGQLEQVLMNLVVNARDAMPDGGVLTVSTAVVLDEESGQRWVQVVVSDTGTGMDEEIAARVFDPFFTTKPRGQGTGLGLAVVQGIVAKGGGRLRVDTAPGQGTRMNVALPAAFAPTNGSTTAPPRRPGRGQLVVVVEDDAALRTVIAAALGDAGYTTVATDDPAVALATVTTTAVPVVVSDVVMADVSGPELAEQLRAARPGLQVLLMSGYADGRLEGQDIALHKPFSVAQLVAAVEQALERSELDAAHPAAK
jgi:signal transduction histidine kinase